MLNQNPSGVLVTPQQYKSAINKWVDWSVFACPFFVTPTFRQHRKINDQTWEHLNPDIAKDEIEYLLKRLTRRVYGNAAWRHKKRIYSFAVTERAASERLHYHLIIDCPKPELQGQFPGIIASYWRSSFWADKQIDIQRADRGALEYMLKLRTKPDYSDAFDWHNTHLPT